MLTVIFSKLSIEKNKAAKRWLSMISCLHFFVCCSHLLARPLGIHTKSLPGALPVCTTALHRVTEQSLSHQGNLSNSNLSQSVASHSGLPPTMLGIAPMTCARCHGHAPPKVIYATS